MEFRPLREEILVAASLLRHNQYLNMTEDEFCCYMFDKSYTIVDKARARKLFQALRKEARR